MPVLPRARRFTVDEYERMVHAGVFASDDRVELIEGKIIEMIPIGIPHASIVDRLTMLMAHRLGDRTARPDRPRCGAGGTCAPCSRRRPGA